LTKYEFLFSLKKNENKESKMKEICKKLPVIFFLIIFYSAHTAYLSDVPVTVFQPNGDELHCFASGDEFHNWLHDENGFTIIQSESTGFYMFAEKQGERVIAGSLLPGRDNPAAQGLSARLNLSREEYLKKRNEFSRNHRTGSVPSSGNVNNVIIFIHFSDQDEFSLSVASIENTYNNADPNAVSFKNYFWESSYNTLDVTTHFLPTQTGSTIISFQDIHPRNYYRPYNEVSNPIGYNNQSSNPEDFFHNRRKNLYTAAANYVEGMLPSNVDIDANNDGYVDNVIFFLRGGTDGWGSFFWPHMTNIAYAGITLNNKIIGDVNQSIESMSGLSVACHEFTHSLGAPDLYHYG
jgi:hypothetical protein